MKWCILIGQWEGSYVWQEVLKIDYLYRALAVLDLTFFVITELRAMSEKLYGICKKWFTNLPSVQQSQIRQHLGEFPGPETDSNFGPNGTTWHWWMIAVLPLDPRIQLTMLAMTSYKERLQGLGRVLGYLKNKRDSRWLVALVSVVIVVINVVFRYFTEKWITIIHYVQPVVLKKKNVRFVLYL